MRLMITLSFVAALAFSASYNSAAGDKDKTASADDLIGAYRIESGERAGLRIAPEQLKDVVVRIQKNALTTYDKDKKEVYAATYELDGDRRPWRITMTATIAPKDGAGAKAVGLIDRKGDRVMLIYALPGGQAPSEFKTEAKQQMFVLKRMSE